jgi:hypothetical protein
LQPLLQSKSNKCYIFWECALAFGIQHEMQRRHIVICGLPSSTVFFHIILYRHDFRRIKFTEHKMCVLIFSSNLSETFLILRIIELDMIKMCIGLHVKYPLFLSDFNDTRIFSTDFRKIIKYQLSWKSAQWNRLFLWGLMQTVRQDEASSRFSQFCERA